ncbi:MAG: DMT family transporter [bacterium]
MKKILGILAILLAVLFWGMSFVSIDAIIEVIDPVTLGFFRYVFAVIFVLIIALATKMSFKITKKDLLVFFLAGFMGIFLYSIFENSSMLYISSETASILVSLTPMAMAVGNLLVFRERITWRQLAYIVCSIAGVVIVVYDRGDGAVGSQEWIGYVFMVLSIGFWTVYSLIIKKARLKYDSMKVTTLQSIMALVIFLPTLLFRPFPDFAAFTGMQWAHLLFLGIICSGVCYFLYVYSVNALGVTVPNVFINFIPFFTVLTNVLFFGQTVDGYTIIGGAVIILTMTMLTIDTIRQANEKT